jgi:hypothetical protein
MATELDILQEARRLIDEKGWTQGQAARTRSGKPVEITLDDASCFCTVGALSRACMNLGVPHSGHSWSRTFTAFRQALPGSPDYIAAWNDAPSRTKDDVLKAFDKAIETVRARHGTV